MHLSLIKNVFHERPLLLDYHLVPRTYYLSNPAHIITWIAPHFPNAQGFTEKWNPQKSKVREVCASRSAHRRLERVISSHRERWAPSWPCLRLIGNTSITPDGSSPLTALPNRSDILRIALIYRRSPILPPAGVWLSRHTSVHVPVLT